MTYTIQVYVVDQWLDTDNVPTDSYSFALNQAAEKYHFVKWRIVNEKGEVVTSNVGEAT